MANIVANLTTVSTAESTTGWGGDTFSLENEIFVQGSNSVSCAQTSNGTNDVYFTGGSWDMSNSHIRVYMNSNIMPNTATEASNGIQVFLYDNTNTAYWTVGGSDTYSGGWTDWFFDVESTATSGSVNTAAVTRVGIRINTNSKPRNAPANGWYDYFRFGDGLVINSTASEAIAFQDVADADIDTANAWGILQETDGVLFGRGKLTLGSTAALNCNFVSSNETVYFIDRVVDTALYGIVIQENTGTTDIDISGLVCKTVGTSGAELDFSASVNSFSIIGSTFIDMGTMTFNAGTVSSNSFTGCGTTDIPDGMTFTGNTWTDSDQIDVNSTGAIEFCTLKNTSATAAVLATTLANITDNIFVKSTGTHYAVELSSIGGGSMTWDNEATGYAVTDGSTGNETIYVNVGSGNLTINVATGATTPTIRTAGAVVTVVSGQVTTKITAIDVASGDPVENARVYLIADTGGPLSQGTVIFNDLTDVNGEVSDIRSLGSNQPCTGRVRRSTTSPLYKTSQITATINNASGLNLTVALIPDE